MSELPRVSIVTPSYNQKSYLEQTLTSVLEQDYPNLEYMVVDGASTDGSVAIIQKYASRLAWWVSEKDKGQAEGINKGLARATGEIIGWLNSDDLYLPGTLSAVVEAFQQHPECGLIYGDMLAVDADGKTINLLRFGDYQLEELAQFKIIGQPAVFFRRSMLEKVGLLDPSYHFLLDHHLWVRMAQMAPIYHVPAIWAAARFHPAAKNVAQAALFGKEAFQMVQWMADQPAFSSMYNTYRQKITGGAYQINGYYLSEGGQYSQSLRSYWKCLLTCPPIFFGDWKRVGYTVLLWLKLSGLIHLADSIRQKDRRNHIEQK